MMPRTESLPGIADTDVDGFLRRLRRDAIPLYWVGLVLGAVVFVLTPPFTIGVPLPAFAAPEEAPRSAHRANPRASDLRRSPGRLSGPCLRRAVLGCRRAGARSLRPRSLSARSGDVPAIMSLDDDRPHVLPRDSRGSHVSFRPRGETVEIETDYVVVGSGAGGATAAVTLARGGAKVAIVEAGPWREPADYASSVYGALRDMVDAWGSNVTRGRAFWPIVQASLVGGTTVINSAIGVRTPADIFEQWEREHGVGGAQMAEAVWRAQDGLERELSLGRGPGPLHRTLEPPRARGGDEGGVREPLHEALREGLPRQRRVPAGVPRRQEAEPQSNVRPRDPRTRGGRPLVRACRADPLRRETRGGGHGALSPSADPRARRRLRRSREEGGRGRGVGHAVAAPPSPIGR